MVFEVGVKVVGPAIIFPAESSNAKVIGKLSPVAVCFG